MFFLLPIMSSCIEIQQLHPTENPDASVDKSPPEVPPQGYEVFPSCHRADTKFCCDDDAETTRAHGWNCVASCHHDTTNTVRIRPDPCCLAKTLALSSALLFPPELVILS